jgi:hypothetical protein
MCSGSGIVVYASGRSGLRGSVPDWREGTHGLIMEPLERCRR